MNQIAVLKRLTIVQKPLIECLFRIPENSNLPFATPIPIPKQVESFGMRTKDEKQGMASGDEETRKTD